LSTTNKDGMGYMVYGSGSFFVEGFKKKIGFERIFKATSSLNILNSLSPYTITKKQKIYGKMASEP